jgi:hypothetical protein
MWREVARIDAQVPQVCGEFGHVCGIAGIQIAVGHRMI